MPAAPSADPRPPAAPRGRLLHNLVLFARVLRAAGLPLGPGKVIDAVAAVQAVGITRREDFYWALHAVFVNRARQLGQGAVTLLISDGLDRDAGAGLGAEVERLHKSCRRLIWLNPLLRYDRFEPRSLGMRAILPHVDEFRAVHSLESLESLIEALGRSGPRHEEGVSRWLRRAR